MAGKNLTLVLALNNTSNHSSALDFGVSATHLNLWFAITLSLTLLGAISSIVLLVVMALQRPLLPKSILLLFHLVFVEFLLSGFIHAAQNISTFRVLRGGPVGMDCVVFMTIFVITTITGYTSALTLAVLRFLAVTWTRGYEFCAQRKISVTIIIICWVSGVGLTIVPDVMTGSLSFGETYPFGDCGDAPTMPSSAITTTTIGIFLPNISIVVIYIALYVIMAVKKRIKTSVLRVQPQLQGVPTRNQGTAGARERITPARRRSNLTRVLFISSVWNALCFLPVIFCIVIDHMAFFANLPLQLWLRNLSLLGYALNPVIFLALNQGYRKTVVEIATSQWRDKSRVASAPK